MRIIVCGGRDFSDREALFRVLDDLHSTHGFTASRSWFTGQRAGLTGSQANGLRLAG